MTLLDVLLLVLLFGFGWFGFWFGLIHALGGLLGSVIGVWVAGYLYAPIAIWLASIFGWAEPSSWLRLFTFIALFIIVNRLVGFVFYAVDRAFGFLRRIPFLSTIDRLAGGVLGLVEGGFVIGITLFFADRLPLPASVLVAINESNVAQRLIAFAAVLVPLLPQVVRRLQPYLPASVVPQS